MSLLTAIVMPKWGLSMEEGAIVEWHVKEGDRIEEGQELVDIETSKINNVLEAGKSGVLARLVAAPGQTLPCGALIGVLSDGACDDGEIDSFVAGFKREDGAEEAVDAAPAQNVKSATVDRTEIQYMESGDGGSTVLLIHGFGGDKDNWLFVQQELAAKFRVIALDLPGHGGSSRDVSAFASLADFANLCDRFAAATGCEKVHLAAHSFGGAIAIAFALRHPQRVDSLTLIAPAGLGAEVNRSYIDGFVKSRRPRELKQVLQLLFAEPASVTAEMVESIIRYKRLDGVVIALEMLKERFFDDVTEFASLRRQLNEIECRTQILWGEADRIVPFDKAVSESLSATVRILPNAGHMPHLEAFKEIAAAVVQQVEKP